MKYVRATKPNPLAGIAGHAGVFLVCVLVYGIIGASPIFLDPDSFYHVKIAELLLRDGIVREFPWLPYTTLARDYADHHFLYHVLLAPFVALYGSLNGAKIATATFAAAAVTSFYAALRAYGSRWPFWFSMLLATSSGFLFRMNLTKASSLSVATLMLALVAIRLRRPVALFALSWAYVWLYGGWPIMLTVVGAFILARPVVDRLFEKHPVHSWGDHWFWRRLGALRGAAVSDFLSADEIRLALASVAGLLCGLVVNPYFPANLRFYWEQIVQIALVNYQETIGVGQEWYPFSLESIFVQSSGVFLAAAAFACAGLAVALWPEVRRAVNHRGERLDRRDLSAAIAAGVLALAFLLLTMRSRRHIEYFTPFATFALALLATALDRHADWPRMRVCLRMATPRRVARVIRLDTLLFGLVGLALAYVACRNVVMHAKFFREGIHWSRYERAAAWMRDNVPAGEVIVHSDWDQFPSLFLRDDAHRYMAGLDPTFLYRQDPDRYWLWVRASKGELTGDVGRQVREGLGARYFFVDSRYAAMRQMLERDPSVARLYLDDEASVYVVR